MTTYTLEELARFVNGQASEIPGPEISDVRPVEHAGKHDITYITSSVFLAKLTAGSAGAVLVPRELDPGERPHIRVKNPEASFARLTALYHAYAEPPREISSLADVHPDARIGRNVAVGAFAVVGCGAVIDENSVLGPHVVVGEDVRIGRGTRIFPHVTIYPGVHIGDRVIVHAGAVIGADGFGFASDIDEDGRPICVKKYHSGTIEIGDDAEIGALCAVDRALSGVTRIGRGVKIDNLVQVAHSVEIGDGTVIAAQVGIAGSSSVGRHCMIGGQVGIKDHVTVGDGVVLASRVGIYRNVPDRAIMAGGVPAMPHNVFLRAQSLFKRLPEMLQRIRRLERLVQSDRGESS